MSKALAQLRRVGSFRFFRGFGPVRTGLKSAFNAAAGLVSRGATVRVAGGREIVVPWECAGASNWHDYEPVTTEHLARLLGQEPDAVVVDIGCSIGIFSLLALSVSPRCTVYSMDADMMSLAIARRMGATTGPERHSLIWGFCGNAEMSAPNPLRGDLAGAMRASEEALAASGIRPRVGANRYTCIDGNQPAEIPCWDLDSLFGPLAEAGQPLLFKVDIEGAEKLMVEGAARLLGRPNVQFLVGVHPGRLPGFGTTREKLWQAFSAKGNEIELIEKDTEEHWWVRAKA